jgi:hypothetical protein
MPATCSTMLSPSGVHVDAESELSSRCAHASGSESADTSSLPRSKSPTRKEERLTTDANTGRPAQSELGILVAVVTGNFVHEHHDLAPQGGIINSHEPSHQP